MEKFIIKHYANDPHPTLKGNGFDGLVIGDYREEAEDFVTFINKLIENQNSSTNSSSQEDNIEEMPFEYAVELGIIQDNSLDMAYKFVEGCSILSNATTDAFESAYRLKRKEIRDKYIGSIVNFRDKKVKIID